MMNLLSEDYLLLSGIQHMAFCERQWALIHLEQFWSENVRTIEGKYLHEKADDPFQNDTRKNVRIVRAMPLISHRLKLQGVADIVEFYYQKTHQPGKSCKLENRIGWWCPAPVEYKRGRPKPDDRDAVQLCAQVIALEEMLNVEIDCGFLFYGQTRRREQIYMDDSLRQHTKELAIRMYQLTQKGETPKAKKGKRCSQCSLVEDCQPTWMLRHKSVQNYLKRMCDVEGDND